MSHLMDLGRKAVQKINSGIQKSLMVFRNRYAQAGVLVTASGSALATEPPTLDTSSAVSFIEGDVTSGIVAVGGAILVLAALAMGYRWLKAAFFG